jgi:hypothetical protein
MTIATDTALQLRARLNDRPKRTIQTIYGNGLDSAFELGALAGGLVSAQGQPTAFVSVTTAWSATAATFTYYPAIVTFSGVISANTGILCVFNHAVFSDAEIDWITANANADGINGMTIEGINWLMADYSRRASWAGGGVSYNDGATLNNLKTWRDTLRSALTVEQGPLGGFESWAEQQQNYGAST